MTTVTGGLAYVVGTLDPYDAATAGAVAVLDHVHDSLRRRDTVTGNLEPGLGAGPIVQVGEHRYDFTLRPDARFSDGTPVIAEDAAASVRTMLHATGAKGQLLGESLRGIRDATATGARTLSLETAGAMPLLDERLALVRVIPERYQVEGMDRASAPATGPYRIVEAQASGVVLDPVTTYAGATGRTRLHLVASIDPVERLQRLASGEFQAIEDPLPVGAALTARGAFRFERQQSQNILFLMFNCGDERLADVRVRRAIIHAIDAGELSREANDGQLAVADSLLPSWHPDYSASPRFPEPDLSLARALLVEAGYRDGLELRLAVSSSSWVAANAPLLQRQLAKIGVALDVTVVHTADLFSTEVPEGDYDLLLSSGDPSVYGVDGEFLLRWYLGRTWAGGYCHWADPAADELVTLLDTAAGASGAHHKQLLDAVQQIAAEHVPIAALGHRSQPSAWASSLTGFRPSRTTGLDLRTPFHN